MLPTNILTWSNACNNSPNRYEKASEIATAWAPSSAPPATSQTPRPAPNRVLIKRLPQEGAYSVELASFSTTEVIDEDSFRSRRLLHCNRSRPRRRSDTSTLSKCWPERLSFGQAPVSHRR